MINTQDFLLELGTEELPPKLLPKLSKSLTDNLIKELSELKLNYSKVESFATPRRLAVLVHDLQCEQEDQIIERKGPSVSASDQAVSGFAKSCGVSASELKKKAFGKLDYYFFTKEQQGLETKILLEEAVDKSIKNIPIAKPMRWGSSDTQFVRPTHWLALAESSCAAERLHCHRRTRCRRSMQSG
jgi:glycyl-tRNA synthetase beta chain